jgi:Cell division protein CrgA
MPISKRRKKDDSVSTETEFSVSREPVNFDSPRWLAPTMIGFMVVGLLWVVTFYVAGPQIPLMQDLSNLENVGIGFGLMSIGFALSTRWK